MALAWSLPLHVILWRTPYILEYASLVKSCSSASSSSSMTSFRGGYCSIEELWCRSFLTFCTVVIWLNDEVSQPGVVGSWLMLGQWMGDFEMYTKWQLVNYCNHGVHKFSCDKWHDIPFTGSACPADIISPRLGH